MPIYAYRCAACGHSKDVLQKLSDAPLSVCPACGAEQFAKQITAAGFQLKGSGWYVTDFRNGQSSSSTNAAAKPATADAGSANASSGGDSAASGGAGSSPGGSSASSGGTPCGGSCACH